MGASVLRDQTTWGIAQAALLDLLHITDNTILHLTQHVTAQLTWTLLSTWLTVTQETIPRLFLTLTTRPSTKSETQSCGFGLQHNLGWFYRVMDALFCSAALCSDMTHHHLGIKAQTNTQRVHFKWQINCKWSRQKPFGCHSKHKMTPANNLHTFTPSITLVQQEGKQAEVLHHCVRWREAEHADNMTVIVLDCAPCPEDNLSRSSHMKS